MPIVGIRGLPIHYQRVHREPEVVMIHGLMANLVFWYVSVLPTLSRNFGVTVYDLRGHGLSGKPQSGYTSADMAKDLIGLLDYLEIDRAHLVGHSFGGAVALHAAVGYPERVRSLVLADARVPSLQPPLRAPSPRQWKTLGTRLRRIGIEIPENVPRVSYTLYEELARIRPSRRRKNTSPDKEMRNLLGTWKGNSIPARQWIKLIQTTTACEDLQAVGDLTVQRIGHVKHPTLAIFGEYTNCLATLRGLQTHLPNCRTAIVPRAGHLHPVVKPRMFVNLVRAFVNGLNE